MNSISLKPVIWSKTNTRINFIQAAIKTVFSASTRRNTVYLTASVSVSFGRQL